MVLSAYSFRCSCDDHILGSCCVLLCCCLSFCVGHFKSLIMLFMVFLFMISMGMTFLFLHIHYLASGYYAWACIQADSVCIALIFSHTVHICHPCIETVNSSWSHRYVVVFLASCTEECYLLLYERNKIKKD